jgi:hypothetical protein
MVNPADQRPRYDEAIARIAEARARRISLHGATARVPQGGVPLRQGDAREDRLAALRQHRVPIDWSSTDSWVFFDADFQHTGTCRIADLPQQTLYELVEYAVKAAATLFYLYAEEEWQHSEYAPGLASKRWLGLQPLFRALVQEALRKNVAFSDAAYVYLRQFVLTAVTNRPQSATLTPWADEQRLAQQSDLREFLDHSAQVVTEEDTIRKFGRKGRAIQLDD